MKISIVMPSFNQAAYVEAALQSVMSQDYADWELIFVDAGSTDGTMAIAERYRDRLAYCVSEPDDGQSDALRKGFAQATGDVLTWLSTDDLLLPGALRKAAAAFAAQPQRSWLLGNCIWIDAQDRILKCWKGEGYTPGFMRLGIFAAGGPSAFFRRALYDRVGGVDLDLHYQMDTDLWWRFAMAGDRYHRLDGYIWALRMHEDAKTSSYMFNSQINEKQLKISNAQKQESLLISGRTASYLFKIPKLITTTVQLVRRAISFNYIQGRIESKKYKQRNYQVLLKSELR